MTPGEGGSAGCQSASSCVQFKGSSEKGSELRFRFNLTSRLRSGNSPSALPPCDAGTPRRIIYIEEIGHDERR
jgi:hypothetical protein